MKKLLISFISIILLCEHANAFTVDYVADEPRLEKISDEVTEGYTSFEEKVRALREYLHRPPKKTDVKQNGERISSKDIYKMNIIEWLDSGYGAWCDQLSLAFMSLAYYQGITTRMVWLYEKKDAPSCHTIAEAYDGKRWVIVDPLYNLELCNEEGAMATRDNIRKNMEILRNNPEVQELAKKNLRWDDEKYLKIYTNPVLIKVTLEHKQKAQSGWDTKIKNYLQHIIDLVRQ